MRRISKIKFLFLAVALLVVSSGIFYIYDSPLSEDSIAGVSCVNFLADEYADIYWSRQDGFGRTLVIVGKDFDSEIFSWLKRTKIIDYQQNPLKPGDVISSFFYQRSHRKYVKAFQKKITSRPDFLKTCKSYFRDFERCLVEKRKHGLSPKLCAKVDLEARDKYRKALKL